MSAGPRARGAICISQWLVVFMESGADEDGKKGNSPHSDSRERDSFCSVQPRLFLPEDAVNVPTYVYQRMLNEGRRSAR